MYRLFKKKKRQVDGYTGNLLFNVCQLTFFSFAPSPICLGKKRGWNDLQELRLLEGVLEDDRRTLKIG